MDEKPGFHDNSKIFVSLVKFSAASWNHSPGGFVSQDSASKFSIANGDDEGCPSRLATSDYFLQETERHGGQTLPHTLSWKPDKLRKKIAFMHSALMYRRDRLV